MHPQRSAIAIVATLLAFMAIFGMSAIAGWHSSDIHSDIELAQGPSAHHSHDGNGSDTDSPIHVAAHCLGHAVAIPDHTRAQPRPASDEPCWPAERSAVLTGSKVASLLRPPRG